MDKKDREKLMAMAEDDTGDMLSYEDQHWLIDQLIKLDRLYEHEVN